jgi:hypothetical protein
MLTEEGYVVLDPFAGSNTTGAAAEPPFFLSCVKLISAKPALKLLFSRESRVNIGFLSRRSNITIRRACPPPETPRQCITRPCWPANPKRGCKTGQDIARDQTVGFYLGRTACAGQARCGRCYLQADARDIRRSPISPANSRPPPAASCRSP